MSKESLNQITDSKVYFQYFKELNLPAYLCFEPDQFSDDLHEFLKDHRFTKVEGKDITQCVERIETDSKAKLLILRQASPFLANQIKATSESDRFGKERITPQNGYRVYRYKGHAMMTYSLGTSEWELGCFSNFGKATPMESRIVLMRFLSWALATSGVIGFWGSPVDDGLAVLKQGEANGEAVFVDVMNKQIFTLDGHKKMKPLFSILRLDSTKNRQVRMTTEELVGFLSTNCTFFDYTTLSLPLRQVIHMLARSVQGYLFPKNSFRPRTDLSL